MSLVAVAVRWQDREGIGNRSERRNGLKTGTTLLITVKILYDTECKK